MKGGNTQVEAAKCLRARLDQSVALVGLQWGDSQLMDAAREAGVCLIPKLPGAQYRQVIRDATACVGQTAGILSASELEALAEDVPLIAPLNPSWYDASHPSLVDVPVLGGTALDPTDSETIAELTLAALQTPVSQRPLTHRCPSRGSGRIPHRRVVVRSRRQSPVSRWQKPRSRRCPRWRRHQLAGSVRRGNERA